MTGASNVIFAGDTNWNEGLDGPAHLPEGFVDVWTLLRPEDPGYSYDSRQNEMLQGYLRQRFDRIFVKLRDFEPTHVELIGKTPLPGVQYRKRRIVRGKTEFVAFPVLPSDHYGIFSRFTRHRTMAPAP